MRKAQHALAGFLPLIDWPRFRRTCLNSTIEISRRRLACFGCGDDAQAVIWLLRRDSVGENGMLRPDAEPTSPEIRVPGLGPGRYRVTAWNTLDGRSYGEFAVEKGDQPLLRLQTPPFATDLALAIQRL
jgi:mannan endo-1,4-beta-mannosidase